ncbi:putative Mg2+ transporter-C (MgtC) family protein [Bradyrhizobium elkanii]|nr:putative Mg2+ transporter-C (MgtC) family protein [Bradyrhizobium elkanii]MCP1970528.1 putative Mg2+ transporter-C (MgtC) family protein [Bradyrhizobium elkanii]MCS4107965.1 putative Mg2+ transporter-C (MgtC) family protein [Bradyrhizobium elkanii]
MLLALQAVEPGKFTDAVSRVIQGVLTGIGFLGAGVIVRQGDRFQVGGLTSAACAFFAACVGIVCGAGHWPIVVTAVVLAFLLLTFGKRTERWLHHALGGKEDQHGPEAAADQSSDAGPHQPGK